MLKEFRAFILRGNVVDLAVGVVIGAAFGAIVNSIVTGLLNPVIGLIGTGDLADKHVCLKEGVRDGATACVQALRWGQVVSAIISFVLIAAAVFFLVVKPVNHLMARLKPDVPAEETTRECPECLSKVPRKAKRCAFCTAEIGALDAR